MPSKSWHLLANFGAEEGRPVNLDQPVYHRLARLWSLLFHSPIHWIGPVPTADISEIFDDTSDPLARLTTSPAGIAWLSTNSSHRSINELGLSDVGTPPANVRHCHDKAFVLRDPLPKDPIATCSRVFHPAERADVASLMRCLEETIGTWPTWAQEDWTLKPRFGSSGRGRVAGSRLDIDTPILRGSLPRLMEQGGFVLQPFCRERTDLSVQLDIPTNPDHPVRVIGSLRPIVTNSGSYQGHQGVARDGTTSSHHPFDPILREQATTLAQRARELGFFGACGIDAFVYEHDGMAQMHLCEFNARWTVGHVVHGIVRRLADKLDFISEGFEFRLDESLADSDRRSIPLTSRNKDTAATLKPWPG